MSAAISMDDHQTLECRKREKISSSGSKDIISRLPDAILCEILSFVPTTSAVLTSVLSKRWNRIWTSVPNLDFSDTKYFTGTPVARTHFLNFVDRVLRLNNVSSVVRKIHLNCGYYCDSSRLNVWISSITKRDSKDIFLELPERCLLQNFDDSSHLYSLPDCFFTHKNLVTLSLRYVALKVPTLVTFPCLKSMHLCSLQLLDDVSMKNLLFGCPILQLLWINRWVWDKAHTLYICSSTLHQLTLHGEDSRRDFVDKVVIDASNLRSLCLSGSRVADFDIIDVSSLVKVVVDFQLDGYELDEYELLDVETFGARLLDLLRKISHVEDLCFAKGTMHSFSYVGTENMPMFKNLTRMKVDLCFNTCPVLPSLFHCMPKLVTFILEKEHSEYTLSWSQPNDVPQCFLSSLEHVEIEGFENCYDEMRFIDYLLKNALILKKLSINSVHWDLEEETEILTQLLLFPRSSSVCVIEYKNGR